MNEWLGRMKALLRRGRMSADVNEELQLHFDMEVEAGLKQGLSADEARRRARRRVGLVSEAVESVHEARGFRLLDGAAGDLRHAYRALARNRGFGIVVVVVLAATVAINTLIFFMLDGVVLRPLPYRSPEKLVRIYDSNKTQPKFPMSIGHFVDYREYAGSLAGIALYTGRDVELSGVDGQSQLLTGVAITSGYFDVLGTAPRLGRAFAEADLQGNVRYVVLSDKLWRDRFHADPEIVGKAIRLNREAWTVIGVAPQGFQHVGGDYRSPLQGETVDVWLPLELETSEGGRHFSHYCNAIARIRDGYTEAQARGDLARIEAAYEERNPDAGEWEVRIEPLLDEVTGQSRQVVWLLVAAGGLVMLVAGANITGLTVARVVARRQELSLRRALGANRWRLVRVGLAENLLLGAAGAALGLVLAGAGLPALRGLLPADFPRAHEVGLTWEAAVFAVTVAVATVLIAGLLPSFGGDALPSLQNRVTSGRASRRFRTALVVSEIALAGLLCAGALFLLRSYQEIGRRDHGFNAADCLTFQLSVPRTPSSKEGDLSRTYEEIRSRIAAIPGVTAAGASTNLPWSGYDENASLTLVGRAQEEDEDNSARYQAASPGYFEATGMRLLAGRTFDPTRDVTGQPLTLIVNDAAVTRFFGGGDAVGAMVRVWGTERQIVGVVAGIKDSPPDLDVKPAFWLPLGQVEFSPVFYAVRTSGVDAGAVGVSAAAAVHSVDADLPVADLRTLDRRTAGALASQRFALWLFQAFAALALALAAAGVYGLLAYVVRQRRKELCIRVALGASRANLWRMIVVDGLKMAAIGALCCAVLIPVGGSLLRGFLFNVAAFDPVTIAGSLAALVAVAVVSSLAPALSATRSDPAQALRED